MTTMEKLEELIYVGFKESDKKFHELLAESNKQFDREMGLLRKEVGKITNSLGRFAEDMVAPAVVRLFNQQGIPITDYAMRVKSEARQIEYDIVAFNGEYVVVVSVKMRLDDEAVRTFLQERLPIFKEVFPRYGSQKVLGAVAGMSVVQEAHVYALKHGLYVLTQSGENIQMVMPADVKLNMTFTPTVF